MIWGFYIAILLLIALAGVLLLYYSQIHFNESCDLERGVDRPAHCQAGLFKLLRKVNDALTEAEIPHWIDYGTLLGAYREKDIIKWTNDVDFSCFIEDEEKILKTLEKISKRYDVALLHIDGIDNGIGCYHYIEIKDRKLPGVTGDIALRRSNQKNTKLIDPSSDKEHRKKIRIKRQDVFPLSSLKVRDRMFPVPGNTRDVLIQYYGEKGLSTPDRNDHA